MIFNHLTFYYEPVHQMDIDIDIVKLKRKLLNIVSQSQPEIKLILSPDPNYFSYELNNNIILYCINLLISRRKFSQADRSKITSVLLELLKHPDIDVNYDGLSIIPKFPIQLILDNNGIPESEEILHALLEAGAYVNIKTHMMGNYFIQMICSGRIKHAKLLLIYGANPYYNMMSVDKMFYPLNILTGHNLTQLLPMVLSRQCDFIDMPDIYDTYSNNEQALSFVSDLMLFEGHKRFFYYMKSDFRNKIIELIAYFNSNPNSINAYGHVLDQFVHNSDLNCNKTHLHLRSNIFQMLLFEQKVRNLCGSLHLSSLTRFPYKYVHCYYFIKYMIDQQSELYEDLWSVILSLIFETESK